VNGNVSRRLRRGLEILVLAAILAAAAFLVAFANDRLLHWMDELKQRSIAMLEERLGRRISYQSISPSVFGFLAVRDLTVHSFEPGQAPLLDLSRVTIHYNLWRLLWSGDPVQAVSAIHLAHSSINVDLERDGELLDLLGRLASAPSGNARTRFSPPSRMTLSGSDISLHYRQKDWSAGVGNLFFSIKGAGEVYLVNLRCSLAYQPGQEAAGEPTFSSRLRISGKVDRRLAWSDLAVRVDSLDTAALSIRRQTFQVTYDGKMLELNKIQDRAPLDIRLTFDRETGELAGRFTAEGFRPASLIRLSGPLSRYDQWLASSVTASGSVTFDTRKADLRYQADMELLPAEGLVPLDLYLASHLHGTDKVLVLQPLIVHSPRGTVEFSGDVLLASMLPSGLLRLSAIRGPIGPQLDASLLLERAAGSLNIRGDSLRLGETTFTAFALRLDPGRKEIPFDLTASVADPAQTGLIGVTGKLVLGKNPSLGLDARLHGLAAESLAQLTGANTRLPPALAQRLLGLSLSLDFELETDFRHYSVSSENVNIYQRSNPDNQARFGFELADGEVRLNALTARWQQYSLAGQAQARISPWQTEFAASFSLQDLPYQIKGLISQGRRITVEGSYGLRAAVLLRSLVDPELLPASQPAVRGTVFSLQATELPIPLAAGKLLLSTDLEGAVTAGGAWYARSARTVLTDIPYLPIRQNQLQASFSLQNHRLLLERLAYEDRISSVSGSGNLTVGGFTPLAVEGSIQLQDARGSERYALNARIANGQLNAVLDFNRSPLARAGELAVSGDLAGSLTANGKLSAPALTANLRLQDGKISSDPLALELSLGYQGELLSLNSLSCSLLTQRINEGRGQWDLRSGVFAFSFKYAFDYFNSPVRMDLQFKGNLAGDATSLPLDALLAQKMNASLGLTNILVENRPYPDWLIRLQAQDGNLSIDGGPNDAIHWRISRTGAFTMQLLAPLPFQVTATGQLQRNRIDAELQVDRFDMRIINDALRKSTQIIQFTKGFGSGRLRISGLVTDPDWFGTLNVQDAAMRFLLSPDLVQPISGQLVFEEKTFYMPRVASVSGKVKVEAEGTFSLDHWIPTSFELTFYIDQYPGGHIQYTFAPVSLDGFATGAVRVSADEVSVHVEGKLVANQCRIALVRAEQVEAPPPEALPLWIDLKIISGRGVEFYWPAINFPVVHTYAKQGEQVQLTLDGDTGQVSLAGSVDIRGGEIFYFDRSFYLKRGNIRFDDSMGEVDPWVSALAEIRERDQNNEEIKIYLEANNKLSQFSPRFYSDPVRTDLDLLGLVGGNVLNRFGDSQFGLSAVMMTTDIVGQFGILAPFERAVRQLLNLDLFSIRSQFLQAILLGKLLGDASTPGALNPLDNTTLSLGKYLGTDLFVQALVRFQTVQEASSVYNIQTEGELSLEWSTPFFLLEWTFVPKHPENLFMSDNSIGLSWKFSY
jgi:hypothetical protein